MAHSAMLQLVLKILRMFCLALVVIFFTLHVLFFGAANFKLKLLSAPLKLNTLHFHRQYARSFH